MTGFLPGDRAEGGECVLKVRVMVFASYREIAGGDAIDVEMAGGGPWRIVELRRCITEQFLSLSRYMGSTLFAVNESMARDADEFNSKDRVAAMPPVSGG